MDSKRYSFRGSDTGLVEVHGSDLHVRLTAHGRSGALIPASL